ncbi:MAG: Crp/Fnr family transcriptional regulator [bacterium]
MPTPARAGTKVSLPSWPVAEAIERRYQADDVIYLAGSVASAIYLVVEGRVRLLREHAGRTTFIHDEIAGGTLGEVPLFEGTTYPATAIAAEPTRCLVLQRDVILSAIRADPELALAVLARLASRVRYLVAKLDSAANQSTLGRLAELVLTRADAAGGKSFTLGTTQQQAAEEIGTVREVLVRGLRTLKEQGAIEAKGGGRFVLKDDQILHRLVASGDDKCS